MNVQQPRSTAFGTQQWRHLTALLALALIIRLLTALLLKQPGYTDAYYYGVGARQLKAGQGFTEPFIWNYLDPPEGVPHAGFTYWMPLASMLGWMGLRLLGDSFGAMQAPFVLLSALLPLVAYVIAWDVTGKSRHALLAGLLAVVPGFYAHVLVLPDSFAPFALAGSTCLWTTGRGLRSHRPLWFGLAGVAAGFGHLARADGLLLAGVACLTTLFQPPVRPGQREPGPSRGASALLVAGGYLLVMGPWFVRNWGAFGMPLPGAGLSTMFLTTYDDLFAYRQPATLESYLAWGWSEILGSKIDALWLNLQRLWAENLLIFLAPFAAAGLWSLRRDRLLWPFLVYLPLLFLVMTVVFTFPGTRGGLFHSGGALLPFFFATTGPGLEVILRWVARRRKGWHARRAWPVFAAGLVGIAVLLTLAILWRGGVLSGDWNRRDWRYGTIGEWLAEADTADTTVMAGDAPAFAWHTGRPAIAIPNDPLDTILAVADRYGADYLVLDDTRSRPTDGLYAGKESHPRLVLRLDRGGWQIYEIEAQGEP
jgi:hypothetical protein